MTTERILISEFLAKYGDELRGPDNKPVGRGLTLPRLKEFGVDKAQLAKSVKVGAVSISHVRDKRGQAFRFYYVPIRGKNGS